MSFVELRAQLRETPAAEFVSEDEHEQALGQTEHDYISLIAAGAKAARLQAELEAADRETTVQEVDAAALAIRQMTELVDSSRPLQRVYPEPRDRAA